ADRRVHLVALDLRDEARRDAHSPRELAYRQLLSLPFGAQARPDLGRRRRRLGRGRVERSGHRYLPAAAERTGPIFSCRYAQSRSKRYECRSGGPGADVSSQSTLLPTAVQKTSPGRSVYRSPSATTSTSPSSMK